MRHDSLCRSETHECRMNYSSELNLVEHFPFESQFESIWVVRKNSVKKSKELNQLLPLFSVFCRYIRANGKPVGREEAVKILFME